MERSSLKRCIAMIASLALCATLGACQAVNQQDSQSQQQPAATQEQVAQKAQAAPAEKDAAKQETATSSKTGSASDAAKESSKESSKDSAKDSDKKPAKESAEPDYTRGTHHATLKIEDYGTVKIEVRSDFAPVTAEEFCLLVDKKYYDGKELYWFLTDIYAQLGTESKKAKDIYKVRGEYWEAGFDNNLSLKRGTIAMSRSEDGRSSDASSLILFLSDCSYLDGKYAAFARVTDGMEVFDEVSAKVNSESKKNRIEVSKNGQIVESDERPVIKSLRMVD